MENNSLLNEQNLLILGISIALVLLIGWAIFFLSVIKTKESIKDLISDTFLQNLTVILVVVGASFLALAKVIPGEVVGSILSGVVGYVLGSIKTKDR